MVNLIREENLKDTFCYLNNVTICGKDEDEHNNNLKLFLDCAKRRSLVFNDDKSIIAKREIKLLGFLMSKGVI